MDCVCSTFSSHISRPMLLSPLGSPKTMTWYLLQLTFKRLSWYHLVILTPLSTSKSILHAFHCFPWWSSAYIETLASVIMLGILFWKISTWVVQTWIPVDILSLPQPSHLLQNLSSLYSLFPWNMIFNISCIPLSGLQLIYGQLRAKRVKSLAHIQQQYTNNFLAVQFYSPGCRQPYQCGLTAILCTIGSDSITKSVIHKPTDLLPQQYFINFIHTWQHSDWSTVYLSLFIILLMLLTFKCITRTSLESPFLRCTISGIDLHNNESLCWCMRVASRDKIQIHE